MAIEIAQVLDSLAPVHNITAKQGIQVDIHQDGLVVWLNVDGVCAARIMSSGFIPIEVVDRRMGE